MRPPDIPGTTGSIYKIQTAFHRPGFFRGKPSVVDFGITADSKGQVKVKMLDDFAVSGFVEHSNRI